MGVSRNWFRLPFVYRPRAERRESPALAAVHWDGATPRQCRIANISSSGAYLLTTESWEPGAILSLTLQRSGALAASPQQRFTVHAMPVRHDSEGVGVMFLLPRGADLRLWQSTIKADLPQTEPEDVVREFRLAAAIAFIHRIAPGAAEQSKLLFRGGLSNYRLASAIEIALHAEEQCGHDQTPRADPTVVLRILEDGSWAEPEWIQHYWAGILATSCAGGLANSDMKLVDLLKQLTTIQARIFVAACDRASKCVGRSGTLSGLPLTCSAEELVQIAETHDRVHIERDIRHLIDLGLIVKSVKPRAFSLIDEAVMTPTPLALELYARCHGHRGEPAEFYAGSPCAAGMAAAG